MQPETHAADRLVFRAISAPNSVFAPNAQELPTLDLIGAANNYYYFCAFEMV